MSSAARTATAPRIRSTIPICGPVREQLLGAEWQCSHCEGWARIRVQMPDYELTVEKCRGGVLKRLREDIVRRAGWRP